jgi:uncharacterized protein YodC (DUF2158 family)
MQSERGWRLILSDFEGKNRGMNQSQFKAGDVVVLKSGGSKMTVADVNEYGVLCVWFENNHQEQKYIAAAALTYPDESERPQT